MPDIDNDKILSLLPEDEKTHKTSINIDDDFDYKLSVPQEDKKNDAKPAKEKKKSWWQSFKENRRQKKQEKKKIAKHKKKKERRLNTLEEMEADLFADIPSFFPKEIPSKKEGHKVIPAPKPINIPKRKWWNDNADNSDKKNPQKFQKIPKVNKSQKEEKLEERSIREVKPEPVIKPEKKEKHQEKKREKSKVKHDKNLMQNPTAEAGRGLGVNLVSDFVSREKEQQLWMLAAAFILFIIAVWVVVSGLVVSKVKNVQTTIENQKSQLVLLEKEIKKMESVKESANVLQSQFSILGALIDNHVYWQNFFSKLEETTIPDVYYISVTASDSSQINLRAVAKNYSAAARQIRAFEKSPDFVEKIEISEAHIETQPGAVMPVPVVAFDVRLDLVDGLLLKQDQLISE